MSRSTREVVEDHLRLRAAGRLEEDLERNVDPDIAVLTVTGVWRGHDGVREQARALDRWSSAEGYECSDVVCDGDVAYMAWRAHAGSDCEIRHGADSYVVRDGRIVAQTIHYVARDAEGRPVDVDASTAAPV